jgi:hypothetical protein
VRARATVLTCSVLAGVAYDFRFVAMRRACSGVATDDVVGQHAEMGGVLTLRCFDPSLSVSANKRSDIRTTSTVYGVCVTTNASGVMTETDSRTSPRLRS